MLKDQGEFTPELAAAVAAMTGLGGAAVALAIGLPEAGFVHAAAKGAALGGLGASGLFGRGGEYGWVWALAGAVLATLIGAALGAVFLEDDLQAAPLGLVLVVPAILGEPTVMAVWGCVMGAIHHGARHMRR